MLRKLVVGFTSAVLFAAAHAKALGLGEIILESSLNQPLSAQIALLQLGDVRPEQIRVQMADESDFARFSIDRESFLDAIQFDVLSRGNDAVVRLRTVDAVREPYLSFVLETRWPSGRLLSEYTVLLDLPAFAPAGAAAPVQQAVQSQSSSSQTIQDQQVTQSSSSGALSEPARFAAPADPVDEPIDAAVDLADEPPATEDIPAPEPEPVPTTPRNAGPAEFVTIGADETLWDIALQVRPDSSVSVQQTMLALQSLNREAFISDNINMVRRGQVLRVPTLEQIRALSAREAMSEVARQNQLFDNRSNVPLASQPLTAQPQSAPADAGGRGQLTVVNVDTDEPASAQGSGAGQSAHLDPQIAALEDALAVQREEADRAALLNAELSERLGLLEAQIASAEEIIRLRDLELAQLQESLAAAAQEPEPVDPPTVITMAPEKTLVEQIIETLVANTYALLALVGLMILMLVFVLLRRNQAAEKAALAGIDGIAVEPGEDANDATPAFDSVEPKHQRTVLQGEISDEDFDEIMNLAGATDESLLAETTPDHQGVPQDNSDSLRADQDFTLDHPELEDEPRQDLAFEEESSEPVAVAPDEAPLKDVSVESAELPPSDETADILETVDTLIAYEKHDEAEAMLRDAIVSEPGRVDLRMKLLEVYVAKQDAVGFKLQESEIRDMGALGVEPRIATLRSQLHTEHDSEILEEGEDDFFEELNALDDMEVALDLEASAEIDDGKVLSGELPDDEVTALASESEEPARETDANDIDFAPDDKEEEPVEVSPVSDEQDDVGLSFTLPETQSVDFDHQDASSIELSAEFDLSADEESPLKSLAEGDAIPFDLPDASGADSVVPEITPEEEASENLIDFDFDFGTSSEPAETAPEPVSPLDADEGTTDDQALDFEFSLLEEPESDASDQKDPGAENATADSVAVANSDSALDEVEFDLDLDTDTENEAQPAMPHEVDLGSDADIEFLDDDNSVNFDDADFDLSLDDDEAKSGNAPSADPFDDLQFLDDTLEAATHDADDADKEVDEDLDFLSDADEAATKLDLARAYFEMGDSDGAREILEEVIREGSEDQVKDAKALLDRL